MNDYAAPNLDSLAALLERQALRHGIACVDAAGLGAFVAKGGDVLILLTEDPARSPETWDVAVILPEILKTCGRRLRAAALMPADSREVAARYGITRYPAQLFLRDGDYVGVLEGMLDWEAWGGAVARKLALPVGRAPSVGIPVRGPASDSACH
ncbi:hydrogenase [Parazoarcus communis]|uniref:Hydrogenase expression/formation protein n=1 Tax=Parazoarcus communis TaxID=41977 RepID=A0A2U8GKG2_9RHOO|nr:hydrogenase [Parazoarcus communis]AWI73924.1 hydrogenase [Parazoarcus communis]TVT54402.1 MAG: hydrogenase [Azoarcus sp. PHD]